MDIFKESMVKKGLTSGLGDWLNLGPDADEISLGVINTLCWWTSGFLLIRICTQTVPNDLESPVFLLIDGLQDHIHQTVRAWVSVFKDSRYS